MLLPSAAGSTRTRAARPEEPCSLWPAGISVQIWQPQATPWTGRPVVVVAVCLAAWMRRIRTHSPGCSGRAEYSKHSLTRPVRKEAASILKKGVV